MGTILGIVGSARPWGNSEILVRQAPRGAHTTGASIQLLRLTNLHLEPCTGCMRCVIDREPCPLDDDMTWLLDTLEAADGLVLAAPTYWLGPAATVKLVLDRLLMVTGNVGRPMPPPRPAVTLATAGLQGWRGVVLPILNALAAGLGFQPIDSLTAVAPGPGEVLLDDELMASVYAAGQRLGRGELTPAPAPPGVCPICRCDAFVLDGNRAICPICSREARVEMMGDNPRSDDSPRSEAEWGAEWGAEREGEVRLRFDPVEGTGQRGRQRACART